MTLLPRAILGHDMKQLSMTLPARLWRVLYVARLMAN